MHHSVNGDEDSPIFRNALKTCERYLCVFGYFAFIRPRENTCAPLRNIKAEKGEEVKIYDRASREDSHRFMEFIKTRESIFERSRSSFRCVVLKAAEDDEGQHAAAVQFPVLIKIRRWILLAQIFGKCHR